MAPLPPAFSQPASATGPGFIIPAYQAAASLPAVLAGLVTELKTAGFTAPIVVVDDGSTDDTSASAGHAGVRAQVSVVRHPHNRGKGAALVSGLTELQRLGVRTAVSLDADGQHLPSEALRLALHPAPAAALLLGIRNLARAGAPRLNRFSNGISNFFLSLFANTQLQDTQCGLRRYPIAETLALGVASPGFAFEAEVILRARAAGLKIVEEPIQVYYPPEHERVTHFDSIRDPIRIVGRVVHTVIVAKSR